MGYTWNFGPIVAGFPVLMQGLLMTVVLAVASMAGGIVIGLLLATARISRRRGLMAVAAAYTEFFRATPLLMQLMWLYYTVPILTGLRIDAVTAGITSLTLNVSAYVGEVFRAGLTSIGRDQWDAAYAMGMTGRQAFRRIILPQAVRYVIPPLLTIWVLLFKDTSLVSIISVAEITFQGRVIATESFRFLEAFTVVALVYLVATYPQARFVDWVYGRFRIEQ
jgi:polar amino acid transport system permease protein